MFFFIEFRLFLFLLLLLCVACLSLLSSVVDVRGLAASSEEALLRDLRSQIGFVDQNCFVKKFRIRFSSTVAHAAACAAMSLELPSLFGGELS